MQSKVQTSRIQRKSNFITQNNKKSFNIKPFLKPNEANPNKVILNKIKNKVILKKIKNNNKLYETEYKITIKI